MIQQQRDDNLIPHLLCILWPEGIEIQHVHFSHFAVHKSLTVNSICHYIYSQIFTVNSEYICHCILTDFDSKL